MGLLDDIIAGIDAEPDKKTEDGAVDDPVDKGDGTGADAGGKGPSWYSAQFLDAYPQAKDQ